MIEYKVVYKQLTQPLREQIFNLWSTNQIMPFDEMLKRIDQVVVVAMDGREVVGVALAFHVLDLVRATESVVDATNDGRHAAGRIEIGRAHV